MEEDLKILNVEYLSNHCTVRDSGFLWGKLQENSEEISSVALLSPACFYLFWANEYIMPSYPFDVFPQVCIILSHKVGKKHYLK